MPSDSLFTKCNTCGKHIAISDKSCPHCGAKQKKLSVTRWVLIILAVLMIIGVMNSHDVKKSSSQSDTKTQAPQTERQTLESQIPEDQLKFVKVVTNSVSGFRGAKNELQQSILRDQRKEEISAALRRYTVNSWVGTINQLETNADGKAILSVRISPDITVKTWNNALSDINSKTLIEKNNPVYSSLLNLSNGQRVKFTGSFFPSETDFIEETSLTIDGSMRNPEFLFSFKSLTLIN